MSRPTGIFKRLPVEGSDPAFGRAFEKLSKADWADLYCDLYRQTHGEAASAAEITEDAAKRLEILKANGIR